jgi:hypothetical protein
MFFVVLCGMGSDFFRREIASELLNLRQFFRQVKIHRFLA